MRAGAPRSEHELSERLHAARARLRTVAVTGTNGKTTTTSMIASIVRAAGEPSARVTTVGAFVDDERMPAPDPATELLATVETLVARGGRTLALETTSKALASGFASRWPPAVAVFTNLTRDHLDLHGSAEAYLASKAQLFLALAPGTHAVLNADDPASALLAEVIAPGVHVHRYGRAGADLALGAVEVLVGRTRVALGGGPLAHALGGAIELGVTGEVHAENAAAAALAAHALGYASEAIARGLAAYRGVPGRFEVVHDRPCVVVDYAHTPDGLERTLTTARAISRGRVWVVFGCGGERDTGKRAAMGEIADRLADEVVVTSDNPRREDPARIADAIEAGRGGRARWQRVLDRAEAIARAIEGAAAADVVVVAGKGHERTQTIGIEARPFADAEVCRAALAARTS